MRKRLNLLILIRGRLRGCTFKTLLKTYLTFIRPVFEFACGVLAPLLGPLLQQYSSLERRIIRRIARLPPWTRNEDVNELLTNKTIYHGIHHLHLKYFEKIFADSHADMLNVITNHLPVSLRPKFKYPLPFDTIP